MGEDGKIIMVKDPGCNPILVRVPDEEEKARKKREEDLRREALSDLL